MNPNGGILHPNVIAGLNAPSEGVVEEVDEAFPTLSIYVPSKLDGSSNTVLATLPDGDYVGQIKTVTAIDVTNTPELTISNHEDSVDQNYAFPNVDDYVVLIWLGTYWSTLKATATII